jgi:superfamily II DNA/RNA helicase
LSGTKSELLARLICADIQNNSSEINQDATNENNLDSNIPTDKMDSSDLQNLPDIIREEFIKYTKTDGARRPQLLPIQEKSYEHVANGGDAVLFAPTGTGKTLAFILPLAARLLGWKRDGLLANKKKPRVPEWSKNDSMPSKQVEPATPSIIVIEPSRELARQVGKVWTRFHPTATKSSKKHVVTVYGGVPMERHAALLTTAKTDVVIGTPGRLRELIREKYLSTSNVKSIVLDEADQLLNFNDVPEVEWLLDGMKDDYQLILASATINKRVEIFVEDVMEIDVGEEGYFVVESSELNISNIEACVSLAGSDSSSIGASERSGGKSLSAEPEPGLNSPAVRHWSMAASTQSRVSLASDLIVTISPRRGIVFASSKAEVEKVAQELSERLTANDVSIHILHGDMAMSARSRAVAAFRSDAVESEPSTKQAQSRMTRVLVATDGKSVAEARRGCAAIVSCLRSFCCMFHFAFAKLAGYFQ